MESLLILVVLVIIIPTIFVIYFIFKILQFVIQAINLYKKMIVRQDATLKLLIDIRDNTKQFESNSIKEAEKEILIEQKDAFKKCPKCNFTVPALYKRCSKCGHAFTDEKYYCDECNAEVPADAKSCPKCGSQFE